MIFYNYIDCHLMCQHLNRITPESYSINMLPYNIPASYSVEDPGFTILVLISYVIGTFANISSQ